MKRRLLKTRTKRPVLPNGGADPRVQGEQSQEEASAVLPHATSGTEGDYCPTPVHSKSGGSNSVLPGHLHKRKGYQNPNTIAQDLRVMQIQASMSLGDPEQDAWAISKSLKQYGSSVLVASSGGFYANELGKIDVLHASVDLDRQGPIADRVNKRRVEQLAREFRPNLMLARSRGPAFHAKAAADALRIPLITYFHSLYDIQSERQFRFNKILASGDAVVVPSQYVANHVKKYYDVPDHRLVLIPRGVDLQKFNQAAIDFSTALDLKDALGLVAGRSVVMMAGRLSFWKGPHLFIEAIRRMNDPSAYGLIFAYGDTDKGYRRELEKLIKKRGLNGRVKIIDTPMDMSVVYSLADVIISASVEPEGFIRTIAEAMALGKPCIAPDHGSSPEQIIHHETGWLYPPGDIVALSRSIQEALSLNIEQKNNLSSWAREASRSAHDLKQACDSEIDLMLELKAL